MDEGLLTNRDTAALIILLATLVLALSIGDRRDLGRSARDVWDSFSTPKVFAPFGLYIAWIAGAAAAAAEVGLWTSELLKATLFWVLLSGIALLFGLNEAIKQPKFFRQALARTLGAAAVLEFLVGLKSFPLLIELPGQALAVVFTGVSALTKGEDKHAAAHKLANAYLALFGLSALGWAAVHLARDWATIDHGTAAREFLLPLWMTPVALVFIYLFAVVAAHESAFKRMRTWNKDGPLLRQRLAVLLRANVRLRRLRLVSGAGLQHIASADNFKEAWKTIGVVRDEARRRAADEAAARQRLIDNAGAVGTDANGRQLDQREFEATCRALRFLAICQMGHYRASAMYRPDLLSIVESHFERDGLPQEHGVEMHVTSDGQGWYATRQTCTGWWFAIGAAAPPPDQWLYDGPKAPDGFPKQPEWDHFGGGGASLNWD